jgi:hypothetical protein
MQGRNLGMGGAFRAVGQGAESTFGNPAALSLSSRYQVEVTGAYDPRTSFGFGSAAVADSTTPLAAGVSYHYVNLGKEETLRTAHVSTLALAFPLFAGLSLGASGKYVLMNGAVSSNAVTLDAGAALKLFEVVALGFSAHNLVETDNPEMPLFYALGFSLKLGPVLSAIDVRSESLRLDKPVSVLAGVEASLIPGVPLRAGYSRDAGDASEHLSFGFSLEEGSNAIDVGYRQGLRGVNSQVLVVTLRFKMQ